MDYQNKKDISFIDIYDDEVATYPRAVTYTGTVTTDSSDSKVLIADSNVDGFTTNFVEFGNNIVGFEEIRKGYYLFDGTEIRRVVGVTPSAQAITLDSPFTSSYEGLPLKVIKPILLPRVTFQNTGNIAGSIYTKTSPTDQTQYGSITLKAGEGYTFDSSTLSAFVIDSTNTIVKLSNAFFFDVTEGGGGGGSETLQQTLALGNESGEYDIVLTPGDRLVTGDNRAGIGKGTVTRDGADGGVSQFCAIGYEKNWQAGSDYILDSGNFIRVAQYRQSIPSVTDDETKGYKIGSFYVLDNGDIYECTDATEAASVWQKISNAIFRKGGKIIVDLTYEITHADAGYYLYFPYETIVTHSISNPLIEGDVIGVQFTEENSKITMDGVIVEAYLYSHSQSGTVQKGEVAIFQAIQDGEILPLTGFKTDTLDGKLKSITRYLYDKTRNTPEYANDAAADADTNLESGEFYKLTGDRTVYIKP